MYAKLTPVVGKLLLIHITLFIVCNFVGFDLAKLLGLHCVLSSQFKPYQLLSHLFIHSNIFHLLSNIVTLVTFGSTLENTLSSKRFLFFYLFTGIGSAIIYLFVGYIQLSKFASIYHTYITHPTPEGFNQFLNYFSQYIQSSFHDFIDYFFAHPYDSQHIAQGKAIMKQLYLLKLNSPIVGASGVVLAILTAFAILFPHRRLHFFLLPISIQARYLLIFYSAYELYASIQSNTSDSMMHFSYLGGILLAYFFIKIEQRR